MTLFGTILKKVKSTESISKKYGSPPPEVEKIITPKKKKLVNKYTHVRPKVDATVPGYAPGMYRALLAQRNDLSQLYAENMRLVFAIKKAHWKGRVDNRWRQLPPGSRQYYEQRANFLKNIQVDNRQMYKRIMNTGPRVVTTASLQRDWSFNRNEILRRAQGEFLLFPPVPTEHIEDKAFLAPAGVNRPRVRLTLRTRGCAVLGELVVELFTDVCPATCRLFLDLLDGDEAGYGYVGTRFFRKVPGLFWSGGDVIYDNGFGCYMQRGRSFPIGAQNFHFAHSMPGAYKLGTYQLHHLLYAGLVSLRVTKDNEMCGIFNITFKPLPQFDLKSEVFGRVVRPCATYDSIQSLGSSLGDRPVIELAGSRRRVGGRWRHGVPNTKIIRNFRLFPITDKPLQ